MPDFQQRFPTDPTTQGTFNSSNHGGCVLGALLAGWAADRFGRRITILVGCVIFVIGGVLQAGSQNSGMLYTGRVVAGVGTGILSMMVPLYQSEIAPKELRGRLISLFQWAVTTGIAVSYWVNYSTQYLSGSAQWRIPLGIQNIAAIILASGIMFMPHSPRWLVDHGDDDAALHMLARLRGSSSGAELAVLEELAEIKQNVAYERRFGKWGYSELVKAGPENIRRRVVLGVLVQAFQQLSGINFILYYAPEIFSSAGLSGNSSSLLAIGIDGLVNWAATIPALFYIDRWGRRPSLISGALLMALCMAALAGIFGIHGRAGNVTGGFLTDSRESTTATIVLCYIFLSAFAYSWGPVGWIYPAEIFPFRIRAKAISVTTASNWLFNFAVGQLSPIMLQAMPWGTYVIFAIFNVLWAFAVYRWFPETACKSLEEMDLIFGGQLKGKDFSHHMPATAATAMAQIDRMRFSERYRNRELAFDNAVAGSTMAAPREHPRSPGGARVSQEIDVGVGAGLLRRQSVLGTTGTDGSAQVVDIGADRGALRRQSVFGITGLDRNAQRVDIGPLRRQSLHGIGGIEGIAPEMDMEAVDKGTLKKQSMFGIAGIDGDTSQNRWSDKSSTAVSEGIAEPYKILRGRERRSAIEMVEYDGGSQGV